MTSGWVGFDLDGTLAHYEGWKDGKIGRPIPQVVARAKKLIEDGVEVRVFTARVSGPNGEEKEFETKRVQDWCEEHIGSRLKVTCEKDFACVQIYDDRAVTVQTNTGMMLCANGTFGDASF